MTVYDSPDPSRKQSDGPSTHDSFVEKPRPARQTSPGRRRSTVSFDGTIFERSHNSGGRRHPNYEIETPAGPVLPLQEEPKWPKDWRAYTCLFGGFLLMFNSWGIVNAYGTFASYYTEELLPGQDTLRMNLIGSTQSFVILLLSAPVGRILDANYARQLLIVGTVLLSVGYFSLSVANGDGTQPDGNYGLTWLTQGFISSLGMGCFFVSSSQIVATWFIKKKGLAIGIVASGASIAGLVYPYMWRTLVEQHGFNLATRYLAILITLTAALPIAIARPNPAHIFRKPEKWTDISVFWDKNAFQNRSFACLVASISFLFFGFYAIFFNLEEWAVTEGFGFRAVNTGQSSSSQETPAPDQLQTYWLLAIMNASSTVGRIGSAYLCDHLGALNVHCAVTFIASLLTLILWSLASSLNSAIAFVVVFGAFSGAVIGLPPASVAYTLGPDRRAQAKLGQWTGMMYSCAAVPSLIGPVIAGHLITEYESYLTVQLWAGACLMLSAGFMAAGVYCRQKLKRAADDEEETEVESSAAVTARTSADEKERP